MNEKEKKEKNSPSTAGYICFSRACAAQERDALMRGSDNLAQIFLPTWAWVVSKIPTLRKIFIGKIAPAGIYQYVIARTKVFDESYLVALKDQFAQIVILGAGMDTRALRMAAMNSGTRIFELDIPRIQQAKIRILSKKKVHLPKELVFVPIDFNTSDLLSVLTEAGFCPNQTTLFLGEGIIMYLDAAAVEHLFRFIRETSASGSRVTFDFVYASVLRKEQQYYGEKGLFDTVSQAGEGWTFGIEKGTEEKFLQDRGFKLVSFFTPADLEQKYFTTREGRLIGRVNGTHCIALAELN